MNITKSEYVNAFDLVLGTDVKVAMPNNKSINLKIPQEQKQAIFLV